MLREFFAKLGIAGYSHCRECGKRLYSRESQKRGYGSICEGRKDRREYIEKHQLKLFSFPPAGPYSKDPKLQQHDNTVEYHPDNAS